MSEDRSLDEFAVSDTDTASDADTASESGTASDNTDETDAPATAISGKDETEPAVPTSTWTDGGADCDRCGGRTQRLWRDDGAVVCADCKEW